eukprot:CAMPEP_0197012094 /NCGR_PEP_ID=MMETSP1380-20130617/61207_1 /TAXON_ID=5936 /ORGANISM="Euplotes crassus, Strain CT5" /LENGTH=151 /DNA_ID=CAMNT_0042435309 /DNA_START=389 /DNA_END=845 /DNA_ORIENTATION=+
MNNEIEEVKEQRRKENRGANANLNQEDDQRIEGQDNPFDDDHQPREEHKDDLHDYEDEDEKYEEDEYYKQDRPRDGPSLNPDRDYDDDTLAVHQGIMIIPEVLEIIVKDIPQTIGLEKDQDQAVDQDLEMDQDLVTEIDLEDQMICPEVWI